MEQMQRYGFWHNKEWEGQPGEFEPMPADKFSSVDGGYVLYLDHLAAMAKKDEQVRKLREALSLVLDSVDYTSGACRLNEMVGATLPKDIIAKALEALEATK